MLPVGPPSGITPRLDVAERPGVILLSPLRLPTSPSSPGFPMTPQRLPWPQLGLATLLLACAPAGDADPGPTPSDPPTQNASPSEVVEVPEALRGNALPLPESALEALRTRQWGPAADALAKVDASKLRGPQHAELAFVRAWALVQAGRAAEAKPLVELATQAPEIPAPWLALVEAEVAKAGGDHLGALKALERIPKESGLAGRADLLRAESLRGLGRTAEAWAVYEAMAQRPDPAPSGAEALLALAARHGAGSPEATAYARRVWVAWPKTPHAVEAKTFLDANPASKPTLAEQARRAERLMEAGDYAGAVAELAAITLDPKDTSEDACRVLYTRGRSQYKQNKLALTVEGMGDAGKRCAQSAPDYGAKALYLAGTADFRRSQFASSAARFEELAKSYPAHSYADDGLLHAGIARQEGGDLPAAQALWRRALAELPEGDTAAESTWRLAWSQYAEGKGADAEATAAKLGALPVGTDPVHVAAGRYWAARWAVHPNMSDPRVVDAAGKSRAVAGWTDLLRAMPHSFYAILAFSRLHELDPAAAAAANARPASHDRGEASRAWVVRRAFFDQPAVQAGARLARLGLVDDALGEWGSAPMSAETPEEVLWLGELRIQAGDWLRVHDQLRGWSKTHPPGTLGPAEARILRLVYPDRYWTEVQAVAKGYRYEPRLFHALSREESNFNRTIVSHAGARGLSQLMPATATQVAGWFGMKITMSDLDDPTTNLKLGSRYLDAMHKQLGDSPYLALAAYNAGAGNVGKWHERFGDVPTDEFVEQIPFRETRGYVKRVMGTWQTMRYQFDDGSAFPDMSAFNHHAKRY